MNFKALVTNIALLTLVLCHTSHAALIDHQSYTTDTVTGMDWLDLTESNGKSYDQIVSQMGAGQQYYGWRYASRADVSQFWTDAGGSGPYVGVASGDTNWVGRLLALWGITYPFYYPIGNYLMQTSIAMTSDASPTCDVCNLTVVLGNNFLITDSSEGDLADATSLNENYRWFAQVPIGHALVRETIFSEIPEPSALQLLSLALFLIVIINMSKLGCARTLAVQIRNRLSTRD